MTGKRPNAPTQPAATLDDHHDRRRHARVHVPLKAHYLDAAGDEHKCLVVNISAGGVLLKAKKTPARGEDVIVYIDEVGRFPGTVIRSGERSFAVTYAKSRRRAKMKRTADALTEVLNKEACAIDRRAAPRIKQDSPALITLEDGTQVECSMLDISLTGASIEIDPRPPLGAQICVGRMNAKVVRRHEKGIGVVFTGKNKRMEQVIEDATTSSEEHINFGPAGTFGKKITTP